MGVNASIPLWIVVTTSASHNAQVDNDKRAVTNYVADGGCLEEFRAAMTKCDQVRWDTSSATKALRDCFGRNPDYFKDQYIKRLDSGLDEDGGWHKYRWWTSMRRS